MQSRRAGSSLPCPTRSPAQTNAKRSTQTAWRLESLGRLNPDRVYPLGSLVIEIPTRRTPTQPRRGGLTDSSVAKLNGISDDEHFVAIVRPIADAVSAGAAAQRWAGASSVRKYGRHRPTCPAHQRRQHGCHVRGARCEQRRRGYRPRRLHIGSDSGALRCRHGDRLVVLYARGVAAVEVAPRGAVL